MSGRIDLHQHIIPPDYRGHLLWKGVGAAGLALPAWSEHLALEVMDRTGVERSIVSVSVPGVHLGDDEEARYWARNVNEFAADLARQRPEKFGFFATLTLPDVDGALEELAYAIDHLGAAGVILFANVGGTYLGDRSFEPLMEELDRRNVLTFVHPTLLPGENATGIPPYIADFLLDTTRAVVNMVRNGVVMRYPGIRFLLSHGGGFVPFAGHRLATTMAFDSDRSVPDLLGDLRSFHVDTAQAASDSSLPSMLAFYGADRVVFGTDWPHASDPGVDHFVRNYDALQLDASTRRAIDRENAERLLTSSKTEL